MAIFHLHVRNISRGDGRSAVAAAAYRAGETLPNEAEERDSAFGGRRDVLHAEIRLPAAAAAWMADRAKLWNAVEAAEKRKDARLAKEIEFALPRDLARPHWLSLARSMADAYTHQGYVVDLAIHDDGTGHNPHAHLLLTTRRVTGDGFGGKIREADGLRFVTEARALWASIANTAFAGAGIDVRIDSRSHAATANEMQPGQHKGPDPASRRKRRDGMEKRLIDAARAEILAADPSSAVLYPELHRSPEWPPLSRDLPDGLTPDQEQEFWQFWQAIDAGPARPMSEQDAPVLDPERVLIPQQELERAEDNMINLLEWEPPEPPEGGPVPTGSVEAARDGGSWWVSEAQGSELKPEQGPDRDIDRDVWWRGR